MDTEQIGSHPLFKRLSLERRCLGGVLAIVMATVYFAYILTIAFRPGLFGLPISEGAVLTWGVIAGAALLSFGFLLTAIYVVIANTRLDSLLRRLQEDLS